MNETTYQILVVDDDPAIRFFLEETLERDGYKVLAFEDGETALEYCQAHPVDLALLDLNLGSMDGLSVMRGIKQRCPHVAIIFLTGHATLETAVESLRLGASDYLFKPCKTLELRRSVAGALQKREQTLRQQELFRQLEQTFSTHLQDIRSVSVPPPLPQLSSLSPNESDSNRFLRHKDIIVDLMRHAVTLDGILLDLTPTEFNLLAYLISESPRVVSPQELVREVQGYASEPWEARDLARFHIYRLRQKIKLSTGRDGIIHTVRGVGYSIER